MGSKLMSSELWAKVAKCKVGHVGIKNGGRASRLGGSLLGSGEFEKDTAVTLDNQLNVSSRCDAMSRNANVILGCVSRAVLVGAER